jgi:glutamyl-Q tRNA(Asp) synthetase
MPPGDPAPYSGRFAPSPTGPLHFGSLLAAVASYLQARTQAGRWLLRIEDIDPPRAQPGAADAIVAALDRYGFEWDGPVSFQSRSRERHAAALQALRDAGHAYPCGCSRSTLASGVHGPLGIVYPGTCRTGCDAKHTAMRVKTDNVPVTFVDALQGPQSQRLESDSGDFIIWRRDGLVAYHLAVVVDDFEQGITEVARGIDLMNSTPRQIWLQRLLQYPSPRYLHIPVAINAAGEKLSKSTGAGEVSLTGISKTLVLALSVLGQRPPPDLGSALPKAIWAWAQEHWQVDVLRGKTEIPLAGNPMACTGNRLS